MKNDKSLFAISCPSRKRNFISPGALSGQAETVAPKTHVPVLIDLRMYSMIVLTQA